MSPNDSNGCEIDVPRVILDMTIHRGPFSCRQLESTSSESLGTDPERVALANQLGSILANIRRSRVLWCSRHGENT
jgi:hypothetical protein